MTVVGSGVRSTRSNLVKSVIALVVLLGTSALPLAAQLPWRTSYFPYILGNPTDGATLIFRFQKTKDAPYFLERGGDRPEIANPLSFAGAFSLDAGAGTLGSRFVRAELRAPGLVNGWRFHGSLLAERTGRFAWYGMGGGFKANPDTLGPDANDNFFRVHRARFVGQVEATRQLVGPLRFALAARLDRTSFTALPDTTLFRAQFGAKPGAETDFVLRPSLVLDTRDREFVPSNGLLLEAGAGLGTGTAAGSSKSSYGMGYVHLRGYVSPREGTVLAARFLWRTLSDAAPISARTYVMGWEREVSPAGAQGDRSFPMGTLAGTRVSLTTVEVRHDLINVGDFGAVTALGFVDYGAARDPLGGRNDAFGGGAGVAIRILRSAILTINFAGGPNGFNFSMGNGWSF